MITEVGSQKSEVGKNHEIYTITTEREVRNVTHRRQSLPVRVGKITIGGNAPVSVQSMTDTKTADVKNTMAQINRLVDAGCELVRVAVPDEESAAALKELVRRAPVPVIADIHFDARLAHLALKHGAPKVRINPGNLGGKNRLVELSKEAAACGAALRVGVNAGSLERELLAKHGRATAGALVESALRHLEVLERDRFKDVVVSLKASDVVTTIEAYRMIAGKVPYPLHLGITGAGPLETGVIKSAVGLGALLAGGIGDTVRVSLTADPVEEVRAAREILQALHLRQFGPELISCPTCGRCEVEIQPMVKRVAELLKDFRQPIRVAVMGCAVNGPGEARDADIGICAGRGRGLVFRKGRVVRTVNHEMILEALDEEINRLLREN